LTSHLTKTVEQTEIEIFLKKFKDRSIEVKSKNGKIISLITKDKEVIAYAKQIGLSKDG
tara:strand:- start:154 stop:330 length:177 start_codon:yes stop_codon:yes gene_type:complete